MKLFHGTSSENLESIQKTGFSAPCYFTTSLEDAEYYAATGGEQSLQDREEAFEERTGINAREHFDPDIWDMYKELYPKGHRPVVLVVDVPDALMVHALSDAGAEGGLVFSITVSPDSIQEVLDVTWPGDPAPQGNRPKP